MEFDNGEKTAIPGREKSARKHEKFNSIPSIRDRVGEAKCRESRSNRGTNQPMRGIERRERVLPYSINSQCGVREVGGRQRASPCFPLMYVTQTTAIAGTPTTMASTIWKNGRPERNEPPQLVAKHEVVAQRRAEKSQQAIRTPIVRRTHCIRVAAGRFVFSLRRERRRDLNEIRPLFRDGPGAVPAGLPGYLPQTFVKKTTATAGRPTRVVSHIENARM
jgi:hypothetical protein